MKSSGIGGQAVLEGVMMKNKNQYAVAVRKPNNKIEIIKNEYKGISERTVIFRLPIFRGMAAFTESLMLGIRTLAVSSEYEEEEGTDAKEKNSFKENLAEAVVVGVSVLLAVIIFILFPLLLSSVLGKFVKSSTSQLVMEGFLRLGIFIGYVALISRMRDIKRLFMYHGAEHKCVNCVEQGYELTIANVKRQSRRHKCCGTSFLLTVMLVSFVLFMFIRVDAAWLRYILRLVLIPVIAGISYEFVRLAGSTDNKVINFLNIPIIWMQKLITKEPDDSMIEVAIASIEAVFDWQAYQEEERTARAKTKQSKEDAESDENVAGEAAAAKEKKENLKSGADTRRSGLISSVAAEEEEDEILRALDQFFIYEGEKNVMERGLQRRGQRWSKEGEEKEQTKESKPEEQKRASEAEDLEKYVKRHNS